MQIIVGPLIEGTVRNSETNAPMAGTLVTVNPYVFLTPDSPAVTTFVTDDVGDFAVYAQPATYVFTPADPNAAPVESVQVTGSGPIGIGEQGPQGTQGFQGHQGSTGAGTQGSQGVQGAQGFQGQTGTTGSQGSQGNQGNQGTQGFQGATGSQGTQGNQGATGTTGPQGNQGTQGVQGTQGNQGFQGNQGNQGNQGVTGLAGFNQLQFNYSTTVTNTDPGSGNFQFDTTTLASVARLNISYTDRAGHSLGGVIKAIPKGTFIGMAEYTVPGNYIWLQTTATVSDQTTYGTVTVTVLASAGSWTNGHDMGIEFDGGATGPQGTQGTQGNQGNQGNQGTQGTQGNQGGSILVESQVGNSGSTQTIPDPNTDQIVTYTLNTNCTFTTPSAVAGKRVLLCLTQGSGGQTATWTTVDWGVAGAPTLSTGSGKRDYIMLVCSDGTHWDGFLTGLGY